MENDDKDNDTKKRATVEPSKYPYGGLEVLTEEEILQTISEFPYVMSKLKDC